MTFARSDTTPPEPATTRRIALLVNPEAGRSDPRAIEQLATRLRAAGATVDLVVGLSPGDLAAAVPDLDVDTVVVAGGDGTINDVVGALIARAAPRPRLAVVPQGTANVLAHEYRLPRDVDGMATAILAGRTRPLHLGAASGADGRRPFFLMASAGVDAAVVHEVERPGKRRFKKLAFLLAALAHGARRLPDIDVTAWNPDGAVSRFPAALVIVTKASHYGGPFVLTRQTAMDQPGLRLVALKRGSVPALIGAAVRLAFGRLEGETNVVSRPVARVRLVARSASGELAVQIDGEPWGMTPIEVQAIETGLELVVG